VKACIKCHVEKPLDAFSKRKDSRDGRRHECRECLSLRKRAVYVKAIPPQGNGVDLLNAPMEEIPEELRYSPGYQRLALSVIAQALHDWKRRDRNPSTAEDARQFLEGGGRPFRMYMEAAGIDPDSQMMCNVMRKIGLTPKEVEE
jgi:hypothetical protein